MPKKRVVGASRLRKKLNRLPDDVKREVQTAIAQSAYQLRDAMAQSAPVSDESWPKDWKGDPRGHLRDAIEARISKGGLRARIGLIGKRVMTVFFFARYLEFGTRYITKRPFIFSTWRERRNAVRGSIKDATVRALKMVVASKPTDV